MQDIKKSNSKCLKPNQLFAWLRNQQCISENGKLVLIKYTSIRLKTFGLTGIKNIERYKYMIEDLLHNCCGVEYIDLTPQLVDINLDSLLFQCCWAYKRHLKDKRTLYKNSIYEDINQLVDVLEVKYDSTVPKFDRHKNITDIYLDEIFGG